ncbi:MAG: hypothetical protein LBV74_01040 [Tannerella sp.]|jgi:hypothetical protein|nr:hypothetical protein [Tannerella sp.]
MAITITPEALQKSAVKYRKELLSMLVIGLNSSLQHMTPRLGVMYKETVGEIFENAELGPYDPNRKNTDVSIVGRDLETFLGSIIKEFDPNDVYQSIYGSLTLHGEGLKGVPIEKLILAAVIKSISQKMNMALFTATRNTAGTASADLFNGFDTITKKEITDAKVSVALKNLFEFGEAITAINAVDQLKAYYRAASDELQSVPVKLFMSKDIYNAYVDDYQQTVGAVPYNREFKKTFLEGSNDLCELVALPNKKGSAYLQLTPKSNMLVGMGAGNDLEKLSVDRFSAFQVTLSMAAVFGVQYETISPERLLIGKLIVEP